MLTEHVPESPSLKENHADSFGDELPDFDEEDYASVSHTRKLSINSKASSNDESMQDEAMRLKINDYDVG